MVPGVTGKEAAHGSANCNAYTRQMAMWRSIVFSLLESIGTNA